MISSQVEQLRNDSEHHRMKSGARSQSWPIGRDYKSIVFYGLILLLLASGCRPFAHLRLWKSVTALSNLTPSLALSWSGAWEYASLLWKRWPQRPLPPLLPRACSALPRCIIPWLALCEVLEFQHQVYIHIWLALKPGADMSYSMLICTLNEFLKKNWKKKKLSGKVRLETRRHTEDILSTLE